MNTKNLFKTLPVLFLALTFFGCKKTSLDYTINYEDYKLRVSPSFPQDLLISETDFINSMETIVEPYLNQRLTNGYLNCQSGNSIYYESLKSDQQKGVVVIFHGFAEFTDKYNEQTYYFLKQGYSVVRFDMQGHGRSTRIVSNPSMVTIENFQYYVDDAHEIIQKVAIPLSDGQKLYCFAHSMGGGVATYYLEQHPEIFSKAFLNCPMIGVNCGKYGEFLTRIIANTMVLFGKGHTYIPGNHDFIPHKNLDVPPEGLGPTVSGARKLYHLRHKAKDNQHQTTGATYYWTKLSIKASRKFRSSKMAEKIQIPVLMFQSQNDRWVNPEMQDKIRSYNSNITLAYFPELEHEMYLAQDKYLYEYYNQIFAFLAE